MTGKRKKNSPVTTVCVLLIFISGFRPEKRERRLVQSLPDLSDCSLSGCFTAPLASFEVRVNTFVSCQLLCCYGLMLSKMGQLSIEASLFVTKNIGTIHHENTCFVFNMPAFNFYEAWPVFREINEHDIYIFPRSFKVRSRNAWCFFLFGLRLRNGGERPEQQNHTDALTLSRFERRTAVDRTGFNNDPRVAVSANLGPQSRSAYRSLATVDVFWQSDPPHLHSKPRLLTARLANTEHS